MHSTCQGYSDLNHKKRKKGNDAHNIGEINILDHVYTLEVRVAVQTISPLSNPCCTVLLLITTMVVSPFQFNHSSRY